EHQRIRHPGWGPNEHRKRRRKHLWEILRRRISIDVEARQTWNCLHGQQRQTQHERVAVLHNLLQAAAPKWSLPGLWKV
ncbi:cyclophilin, partial [Plasmodium cynomolgi strain B]